MGRVYRQARRSEIATKDASRLIYMLDRLRTVLDVVGLERRLDELERRAKELKAKTIQRRISKLEIEIGVPITTLYEGMTVEKLLELLKDPHANPEAVSVFQRCWM